MRMIIKRAIITAAVSMGLIAVGTSVGAIILTLSVMH